MTWVLTLCIFVVAFMAYKLRTSWQEHSQEMGTSFVKLLAFVRNQYRWDDLAMFVGGRGTFLLARMARYVDLKWIDQRLDTFAEQIRGAGYVIARLQNGLVRTYALTFLIGCVLVASYLLWGGP